MPTSLTTLEAVKSWLNLSDGNINADDLLTGLITAASGWIEDYLDRTIGLNSYSQYFNGVGAGCYQMVLPQ